MNNAKNKSIHKRFHDLNILKIILKFFLLFQFSVILIIISENKSIEILEIQNLLNILLVIMSLYIALFVLIASNFSTLNSERFKDIELNFKLIDLSLIKTELYIIIICIIITIFLGFLPEPIVYEFDPIHILNLTNVILCLCLLFPVFSLIYLSGKTFSELNKSLTKEIKKIEENELQNINL